MKALDSLGLEVVPDGTGDSTRVYFDSNNGVILYHLPKKKFVMFLLSNTTMPIIKGDIKAVVKQIKRMNKLILLNQLEGWA